MFKMLLGSNTNFLRSNLNILEISSQPNISLVMLIDVMLTKKRALKLKIYLRDHPFMTSRKNTKK